MLTGNTIRTVAIWRIEDDNACKICQSLDGEMEDDWPEEQKLGPTAHPSCYHKDVDVLTVEGWKNIREVKKGMTCLSLNLKTHEIEPAKVIAETSNYEETIQELKTNDFYLQVTNDHNMVFQTSEMRLGNGPLGGQYKIAPLSKMNKAGRIPRTGAWTAPDHPNYDDWEYAFMGWYLSEGNCHKRYKSCHTIKITQGKGQGRQDIESVLLESGLQFSKMPDYFQVSAKDDLIKRWGIVPEDHSYQKSIPDWIRNSSSRQIDIFLGAYCSGDGTLMKGGFEGSKKTTYRVYICL